MTATHINKLIESKKKQNNKNEFYKVNFEQLVSVLSENQNWVKKYINSAKRYITINLRVWFWLRTNAGGVLNTCKSNERSNTLVADGWVTREQPAFTRGITLRNRC